MRDIRLKMALAEKFGALVIRGFEGDGDSGDGSGGDDSGSQGADGDDSGGDDSTDDDSDDDDDDLPDDNKELKGALKKERLAARAAQKEAKKATREANRLKAEAEAKNTDETDKVKTAEEKATKAADKVAKLASGLKSQAIESAVTKAANKAGFRDADDVMALLERAKFAGIDVDQDEDDPSDIDIDEKSVQRAVAKIAKDKPHLLLADGDTNSSGSTFRGSGGSKEKKSAEDQYKEKYPALRR
jgi:hypothetical protein